MDRIEQPIDAKGRLVKLFDMVRSTPDLRMGHVCGVVLEVGPGKYISAGLTNCIYVRTDNELTISAAFLWEVWSPPRTAYERLDTLFD